MGADSNPEPERKVEEDEPTIYEVDAPRPRPAQPIEQEQLPLPYFGVEPAIPEADAPSWQQFALGCAVPWVVAGIIIAGSFAPLVPRIFIAAAALLAFGGAIQ